MTIQEVFVSLETTIILMKIFRAISKVIKVSPDLGMAVGLPGVFWVLERLLRTTWVSP